jgi:micrococcal nuclease
VHGTIVEEFSGKVVAVPSGDVLTVLREGRRENVRLFGIDCPEDSQAFGQKAKRFTASRVLGKTVSGEVACRDRFGRIEAHVALKDDETLNEALIRSGLAWPELNTPADPTLERLLQEAKIARRGLWADREPLEPWTYRSRQALTAFQRRPHEHLPESSFVAKVSAVRAANRIVASDESQQHDFSFYFIAFPPEGHPAAEVARKRIEDLLRNRQVEITVLDRPASGAYRVAFDDGRIESTLVSEGLAWCSSDAATEECRLIEAKARMEKRGLWESWTSSLPWESGRPVRTSQ